jgi:hypothetical protein
MFGNTPDGNRSAVILTFPHGHPAKGSFRDMKKVGGSRNIFVSNHVIRKRFKLNVLGGV